MKIGLHMSMLCETWVSDPSKYLKSLKQGGLDEVEISLFGVTKEKVKKTIEMAKGLGLDISLGTGISQSTDISSSDAKIRQAGVEYLTECAEFAKENDAKFINGVLYAPWQAFSNEPKKDRWKRSAESLQIISDKVNGEVELHVEIINRFETDFMNTLEEGSEFLGLCDRKNISLLADTFHMNIEENNLVCAVDKYYDKIGCIHVCENHRGVPGTGHIPFEDLIAMLKKKNYNKYLIIESFVQSNTEVGNGMFMWRNLADSPLDEALKGISYLKKLIEE